MRRHLRVIVPYPCCGLDQPTTQNSFQVLWQVFLLGGSVQQTKQTCQQERERVSFWWFFYGIRGRKISVTIDLRKQQGGGFKDFVCSSLCGDIIQFDLRIFFRMGSFNHQPDNIIHIMLLLQGGPDSRNDLREKTALLR